MKHFLIILSVSFTALTDVFFDPRDIISKNRIFLPREDTHTLVHQGLAGYGAADPSVSYGGQGNQHAGGQYSNTKTDLELVLLKKGSDKLGSAISSILSDIPDLAAAARAATIEAANDANFETIVQQGLYITSYPLYYGGFLLGVTATTNLLGTFLDLAGRFITDAGYVYEGLNALVDVGEDCTNIRIDNSPEDIAEAICQPTGGYGNTGVSTTGEYWVAVSDQLESVRSSLSCVSSSTIDAQLDLVKKAAKLRSKMLKRIRSKNIGQEH